MLHGTNYNDTMKPSPAFHGRRVYSLAPPARGTELNIHTLGLRTPGGGWYSFQYSGGLAPDHFFQFFHDPVSFELEGERKSLAPGSLLLVEPGRPIAYGNSEKPWRNSFLRFSGALVKKIWKDHGFHHGQTRTLPEPAGFLDLLESLRLELDRPASQPLVVQGLFTALCGEVLRTKGAHGSPDRPVDPVMVRIKKILEAQFREKLEMRALAERHGMGEIEFSRAFQRAWGMPPGRHLTELRLSHGAQLLSDGQTSVQRVALSCGYEDPFHFSKAFKKRFGVSPSRFQEGAV